MGELEEYRRKIDRTDSEIVRLLAERMREVKKIGRLKRENSLPVIDEERERQVYRRVMEIAREYGLCPEHIRDIYRVIINDSRKAER